MNQPEKRKSSPGSEIHPIRDTQNHPIRTTAVHRQIICCLPPICHRSITQTLLDGKHMVRGDISHPNRPKLYAGPLATHGPGWPWMAQGLPSAAA